MKKLNIVITGRRNVGKSSLINTLTGQKTSIVSDIPGTTTDPVKKSYEVPGFTTIVFTDTAGIDDIGLLGKERIDKTKNSILQADIAILVITENRFEKEEKTLCSKFQTLELPFIIIHNKSDILPLNNELERTLKQQYNVPIIDFSTISEKNTETIVEALQKVQPSQKNQSLLGDIINKNDIVVLITPIDAEAPTGRLILPQVQTIRDILDNHCISIVLQPEEISDFFKNNSISPKLVITDSQVFKTVCELIPKNIPLTSFSIIMARNKGNFEKYIEGTYVIDQLQENDKILILESCSHQVSCEDIGRFKLPALLRKYTGKNLDFNFVTGLDPISENIHQYKLVIQCGGCMVTKRQLHNRIQPFINANIPISNYGMAIAFMNGIFERSIEIFKV